MPSQSPGSTAGAAYTYADAGVVAGQAYWYWLESVDLAGTKHMRGPVRGDHEGEIYTVTTRSAAHSGVGRRAGQLWVLPW